MSDLISDYPLLFSERLSGILREGDVEMRRLALITTLAEKGKQWVDKVIEVVAYDILWFHGQRGSWKDDMAKYQKDTYYMYIKNSKQDKFLIFGVRGLFIREKPNSVVGMEEIKI